MMPVPDSPLTHELSDDDIISRPLESPISLLAATGIEFRGLEHPHPIAISEWKGKCDPPAPPAAGDTP